MPPVEHIGINQTAVYWEKVGENIHLEEILAAPREILCRWIDGETELPDAQGNPIAVQAVAVVKEDLVIGSILRLGTLASYIGSGSALTDDDIAYIQITNKVPDLDVKNYYRSVGLVRYGNRVQ